jgi:CDP-paratose 2-epimerase
MGAPRYAGFPDADSGGSGVQRGDSCEMKYAITGGLGVIGSLIAKNRLRNGDEVAVIDDGVDRRHGFNTPECHVNRHRLGDVNHAGSLKSCEATLCWSDRILHAAASTGIPYSSLDPRGDWSRNVDATRQLLESATVPTVVLSSVKPYGLDRLCALEREDHYALSGGGVDESFPLEPDEPYAASKAAQSLICRSFAKTHDLPVLVFRCSNLAGPGAPHGPRHGWVQWLCIQAALGWTIEIQGSGKQTRDILFWTDVERAAMCAFEALEAGRLKGAIFNLGGGVGNTISVLQLVALLRSFGAGFSLKSGPGRRHEDPLFVTDHSAFSRETGWKPEHGVKASVRVIYEWARDNRDELADVYKVHRG